MAPYDGTILIYSIHRTENWWRAVGESLGFENYHIVSDIRSDGDFCVVDDFYTFYRKFWRDGSEFSPLLSISAVDEVIARCRVLRWLNRRKASAMVLAMAEAFSLVLDKVGATAILSFPIDRYVSDVFERVARGRGIPYFELTAGILPETSMLMYRGMSLERLEKPSKELVKEAVDLIADPLFLPTYLPSNIKFSLLRFLKVFYYFRLRGWAFKAISLMKSDPLNLHYLDSQSFLGHKPKIKDILVTQIFSSNWYEVLRGTKKERVVFIGLPVFPEASLDYWIDDLNLIDFDKLVVEIASVFAGRGFVVMIKDHPLQFGFRKIELLEKLKAISGVYIVPYEVTGTYLLSMSGVSFSTTGSLGLQAAMVGLHSIVTPSYYSNEIDFHVLKSIDDISKLPMKVMSPCDLTPSQLRKRQYRIMERVVRATIYEDLYSRNGFDGKNISPKIELMGKKLGEAIFLFGRSEQNWHGLDIY